MEPSKDIDSDSNGTVCSSLDSLADGPWIESIGGFSGTPFASDPEGYPVYFCRDKQDTYNLVYSDRFTLMNPTRRVVQHMLSMR